MYSTISELNFRKITLPFDNFRIFWPNGKHPRSLMTLTMTPTPSLVKTSLKNSCLVLRLKGTQSRYFEPYFGQV